MRWAALFAACVAACELPPGESADGPAPPGDGGGGGDGGVADRTGAPDGEPAPLTALHLRVFDSRTGRRIPAKVLFTDEAGNPLQLGNRTDTAQDGPYCSGMGASLIEIGTGGALATWNGVALWRGEAIIPIGTDWSVPGSPCGDAPRTQKIPYGRYRLTISRGLEYEVLDYAIDLSAGRGVVFIDAPLARTVDTDGYLAADMHVHATPGSGDSSVTASDRVKSEVAVGIEVLVSSDHDYFTDFGDYVRKLWADPSDPPPLATVAGVEATGTTGHFSVIPVPVDGSKPRGGALARTETTSMTPQGLFDRMHALPTAPIVQMNHTRLGYAAYFDSASCGPSGWRDHSKLPDCSLDFEAMEVLNGFLACDTRIHQTLDDWYALLKFGVVVTATGNSDTHYTSGILGGFPRTYVAAAIDTPAGFEQAEFVRALRGHHAIATTGPFLTLRVDDVVPEGDVVTNTSGKVKVSVRMEAASWIHIDVVRLRVDGEIVKSWPLRPGAQPIFRAEETLAVRADAFITAEAEGHDPLPAWIVGEYLSTKNRGGYDCPPSAGMMPGMIPFGVTNPVFVDADGDGRWKGPQQPIVFPAPNDVWIPPPFPDGVPDCDPRHALLPIK